MHQSHNMGYAEYGRKLENQIAVEKRRQDEYVKCKNISAEIDSHLHK